MTAVAFNHRDLWIRKGKYPGIDFGRVLGSDGVGVVIASAEPGPNDPLLYKRVFLTPMHGWYDHPDAPEIQTNFGILGGGKNPTLGTFAEYVVVERDEVILAPDHLDNIHMAAWPLGGLTAWRVAVINANVQAGHKILITGIGGGVALMLLQICIAKGASVYVTSSSDAKICKATELGAKGGVNYKMEGWSSQLKSILRNTTATRERPELDAVLDSAGGDIFAQIGPLLKTGGRVVCYGMTAVPRITFTMREVLKNQRVIGSTMGSKKDMIDATTFMAQRKFVPVVSRVLKGLESVEEGFQALENMDHFGKIVITMEGELAAKL